MSFQITDAQVLNSAVPNFFHTRSGDAYEPSYQSELSADEPTSFMDLFKQLQSASLKNSTGNTYTNNGNVDSTNFGLSNRAYSDYNNPLLQKTNHTNLYSTSPLFTSTPNNSVLKEQEEFIKLASILNPGSKNYKTPPFVNNQNYNVNEVNYSPYGTFNSKNEYPTDSNIEVKSNGPNAFDYTAPRKPYESIDLLSKQHNENSANNLFTYLHKFNRQVSNTNNELLTKPNHNSDSSLLSVESLSKNENSPGVPTAFNPNTLNPPNNLYEPYLVNYRPYGNPMYGEVFKKDDENKQSYPLPERFNGYTVESKYISEQSPNLNQKDKELFDKTKFSLNVQNEEPNQKNWLSYSSPNKYVLHNKQQFNEEQNLNNINDNNAHVSELLLRYLLRPYPNNGDLNKLSKLIKKLSISVNIQASFEIPLDSSANSRNVSPAPL